MTWILWTLAALVAMVLVGKIIKFGSGNDD